MFDPGLIDLVMFLRQKGISDTRLLSAFETTPRRYFVGPEFQDQAYANRPLPIACGQTLPSPLTLAMMAHFAKLEAEHKVLLIGVGSGYFAAVLSKLVRRIYAVERYKTLCESAEVRLSALEIVNIVIDHGDGLKGWTGQAPFDRIVLTGSVESVPKHIIKQLSEQGLLLYVQEGVLMIWKDGHARSCTTLDLPPIELGMSKII
ncbi:MAG: protein-L-isoaspartate(D-aspartate) O-methyltransferase [Maricaulaceae bacterium]